MFPYLTGRFVTSSMCECAAVKRLQQSEDGGAVVLVVVVGGGDYW